MVATSAISNLISKIDILYNIQGEGTIMKEIDENDLHPQGNGCILWFKRFDL